MWADVMDSMTLPESLLKSIVKVGYCDQFLFLPSKSQIMAFEKENYDIILNFASFYDHLSSCRSYLNDKYRSR